MRNKQKLSYIHYFSTVVSPQGLLALFYSIYVRKKLSEFNSFPARKHKTSQITFHKRKVFFVYVCPRTRLDSTIHTQIGLSNRQISFTEAFNVFRLLKGFTTRRGGSNILNFILRSLLLLNMQICHPGRKYKKIHQTSTKYNFKSLVPSQIVLKPLKSLKILKVSGKRI